ncbi:MoaF-related domain-containing protein [Prevotella histicola]|uniref:MoaF-related domain-containing protein n=2 Tax=Prevotella histicola TaxID=470565 RepID=UPI00241C4F1C|nr:hypothetical protein [Prevotella histicola]
MTSLALLASACYCKQDKCNTQDHEITLIGHMATLSYPGLTANVKYLNDSTIYWKTTDEKDSVAEGTNRMVMKKIDGTKFFVSWIEKDGTTVSQIIDLEKKTVEAFLTFDDAKGKRIAQTLEGTFEVDK